MYWCLTANMFWGICGTIAKQKSPILHPNSIAWLLMTALIDQTQENYTVISRNSKVDVLCLSISYAEVDVKLYGLPLVNFPNVYSWSWVLMKCFGVFAEPLPNSNLHHHLIQSPTINECFNRQNSFSILARLCSHSWSSICSV